ncbi:MAG: hypothetical protein HOM34_06995 [Planctomycetes bacterium]|nr:hypothetical protein [Planctomycetota bacterium]MBT4029183.1 hypothetical protein [Planctomycetota bacterium]MBT4559264.1 hypothetical protein [Planctomycetota bacterium]MBT5101982.1 hypothetical protein [Planctomycetota bacterium]MBT5120450.1 hypothetical protein [Planctomycetota bacterium]
MILIALLTLASVVEAPTTDIACFQQSAENEAMLHLMADKCRVCHNPESYDRKARRDLPDASDLRYLAEEFVAPGDLEMSDLWLTLQDNLMPPSDCTVPPLTADERAVVRDWIMGLTEPGAMKALPGGQGPVKLSWVEWLSHHHSAVVHFPIALLLGALLAFLLGETAAMSFCLRWGVLSILPAIALGLLNKGYSGMGGNDVELHEQLGFALASLSALTWWLHQRWLGSPKARHLIWPFLAIAAILFALGHTGGPLVFGEAYFRIPL